MTLRTLRHAGLAGGLGLALLITGCGGNSAQDELVVGEYGSLTGNDADFGREQLAGHQVAAAARGEQFDDLRIAGRDDEDGDRRRQHQKRRQEAVGTECQERLLGTVARRAETVGTQTDPGQEGDQ